MKILALTLTIFFFSHLGFAAKFDVRVSEMVTARQGAALRFGDLVSGDPVNSEVAQRLYDVSIYPQVNEEKEVILTNAEIALTLRRNLSFQDLRSVTLKIPDSVKVQFRRNFLSHNFVKQTIIKSMGDVCVVCDYEVRDLKIPEIDTKDEILGIHIDTNRLKSAGTFLLPLSVETSRGKLSLWITGQLQAWALSPVAIRQIKQNEKIEATDFEVRRVNISMSKDGVANPELIIGRSVSRAINMGQPIFQGDLKRDPAIQRGQIVQILIGTDQFEITSSGTAEETGFLGDMIKVRSTEAKTLLSGVLVEKGVVKIQ